MRRFYVLALFGEVSKVRTYDNDIAIVITYGRYEQTVIVELLYTFPRRSTLL